MQNINYSERIKSLRKSKGLTQQQLADQTGLSLRTIQRVEKGTEEISGYSLNQISKELDIPLEQIIMQNVDQISIDNNQTGSVRTLYLVSLFFIINPILGFLVPYIYGNSKQNRNTLYNKHLRKITTFHCTYILVIVSIFILFFTSFIDSSMNSLMLWQLTILCYILYVPIATIWTIFSFKKMIKTE